MSTKLNSTLKRLVTFLLVVVMIAGMLPLTVSAENQGGGSQYSGNGDASSSGKGTGGAPIPGAPIYYGRFTRYTLVRFDFTDDSKVSGLKSVSDWSTGKAVGSIDVVTEVNESIPTSTKYLRTVFKNKKGSPGSLHLIVDYNIPGAEATTAPNGLSGNIVDCGGAAPGSYLDVDLEVNGQKLIPGVTEITPVTGVTLKLLGLSTDPKTPNSEGMEILSLIV